MCIYAVHVAGARAVQLMSQFIFFAFLLLLHPSCGQGTCTGLFNVTEQLHMDGSKHELYLTLVIVTCDCIHSYQDLYSKMDSTDMTIKCLK